MSKDTYFIAIPLARRALTSSIFGDLQICSNNAKIYKIIHISKFFTNFVLDEALTLAYCVDARTCNLANISEADTLTQ